MKFAVVLVMLFCGSSCRPPVDVPDSDDRPKPTGASGLLVELKRLAGEGVLIEMTVRNPTTESQTFCRYQTPFEGFQADIFEITPAADRTRYIGPLVKRRPPGPDDDIRLAAGESRSTTFDLAVGYDLPAGRYDVRYRRRTVSRLPASRSIEVIVE